MKGLFLKFIAHKKENSDLIKLSNSIITRNIVSSISNIICFFIVYQSSRSEYLLFTTIITTMSIFFAISSVMFSGASIELSKRFGFHKNKISTNTKDFSSSLILFSLLFGILLSFSSNFFLVHSFESLSIKKNLIESGSILSFTILFMTINSCIGVCMQTQGLSMSLTKYTIFYNITKVLLVLFISSFYKESLTLNIFFMYVILDFSFTFLLLKFSYDKGIFSFNISKVRNEFYSALLTFKRSIPICIGMAGQRYFLAYLMLYAVSVGTKTGEIFGITLNILMLIAIPIGGYAHACAILNGHEIGSGLSSKWNRLIKVSILHSNILISIFVVLFLCVFLNLETYSFIKNSDRNYYIISCIVYFYSISIISIFISFLRSHNKIIIPQLINTLVPLIISMTILGFGKSILNEIYSFKILMLALSASGFVNLIMITFYFVKGFKIKHKEVLI